MREMVAGVRSNRYAVADDLRKSEMDANLLQAQMKALDDKIAIYRMMLKLADSDWPALQ